VSLDWRQPDDLIGQPISRFFDMEIDDLPDLTRQRRTQDRLVFARDGNALFAHAIEPNVAVRVPASVRHEIPASLRNLGGGDPQLAMMQAKAAKLAAKSLSILIQGETGTGKEYLARAIHDSSAVKGRFVAVNCAAIPEQLIEGELFGHLPGAFTGANAKGRKGLIEEADGGTLFLDEIGDMPLPLQSRLLRVLAEKEVLPIGAARPKPINIRVISASHRMIESLVRDGHFREDLFYRLNAATLSLPPLRERSDFEWLLDAIVEKHRAKEGSLAVAPAALDLLKTYAWPGNIRELDNVISVAAALCQNGVIEPCDLPEALLKATGAERAEETRSQKSMLEAMLAACGGNVSEAARRLDVDRSTVHRQMKRYGLNSRG
jgi:transcriptional regulator of acetoin/glycerol metabolism